MGLATIGAMSIIAVFGIVCAPIVGSFVTKFGVMILIAMVLITLVEDRKYNQDYV